jgi:pteridine reductase
MAERRVALVTGGAKRVGRAIVERLAAAGFDVAFTYLNSDADAADLRNRLESSGANAIAIKADLTHAQRAADAITSAVAARFARLDVLVNSASLYEPATLEKTTLALPRWMMAIHFESPLLLAQAFAPLLRSSSGHVVNMLDLMVERPWPQYIAYCASKSALWNLTLSLARELAPEVTVNGIAPGVVEWPDDYPEAERQRYLKRVPLGRPGTPQDVAETVHFLCTGGSYMTGQVIRLDGGRSIT